MGAFKEFYLNETKDQLSKEYTYEVIYNHKKIEVWQDNVQDQ